MSTLDKAFGFAACAHRKQKRKYTNEPYLNHCINVATILEQHLLPIAVCAAGLLHDVIEDCDVTADELREVVGHTVVGFVLEVTDVSAGAGNRAERKKLDREHLAASTFGGASIKLADLIDNTSSIVKYDKNFARVYLAEKALLLPLLKHGHEKLWKLAYETLVKAQEELVQFELGGK